MKKILSNIYLLAALFMIGAAITSCSKSDDTPTPEPKPVGPTTYTMTIKASKGGDAKTRALSLNGSTLTATWKAGEKVYVYNVTESTDLGGYLEAQGDGASTTLMGTLTGTIKADDELTLKFCSPNYYATQDGTLEYIAANCDYATARVDVNSVSNTGNITPKAATTAFTNHQAIVKFTLKDYNGAALSPNPTTLTVKYGENGENSISLSIPPSTYNTNGDGVLYVAIPGITNQKVTLTATVGNDAHNTYTYVKSGVTFTNGQYYAINVSMVNPYKTPLTLECCATDGAAAVWVTDYSNLEYKVDDGEWATYSINQINLSNGQKVSFRGTNSTTGSSQYMQIHCNDNCYIYGNIMSLLYEDFATKTTLPYENTFVSLFQGNAYIKHTEGKDLVLPATKLISQCYTNMFNGCTQLDHIKCLATEGLDALQCTSTWLVGTPDTGTFIKAKGASWTTGDSGIPSGWNVIEE